MFINIQHKVPVVAFHINGTKLYVVNLDIAELFVTGQSDPDQSLGASQESKKISNDQELIQSDPISCPQNQKGNN